MKQRGVFPLVGMLLFLALAACGPAQATPTAVPIQATAVPTAPAATRVPAFEPGQFVYTLADGYPGMTVWSIQRQEGDRRVLRDLAMGTEQTMDKAQLSAIDYVLGAAPLLAMSVPIYQYPRTAAAQTGKLVVDGPAWVVVNPHLCVADPGVPGSGTLDWCYVVVFNQAEGWVQRSMFGNEWTISFEPIN